jgi:hypothetical protein
MHVDVALVRSQSYELSYCVLLRVPEYLVAL